MWKVLVGKFLWHRAGEEWEGFLEQICSKCDPQSSVSLRAFCRGPLTKLAEKLSEHLGTS